MVSSRSGESKTMDTAAASTGDEGDMQWDGELVWGRMIRLGPKFKDTYLPRKISWQEHGRAQCLS